MHRRLPTPKGWEAELGLAEMEVTQMCKILAKPEIEPRNLWLEFSDLSSQTKPLS